tara:strand:- start:890 stop:1030 length:141 start_codon:yes stop_codon:yes gene_type:complete
MCRLSGSQIYNLEYQYLDSLDMDLLQESYKEGVKKEKNIYASLGVV